MKILAMIGGARKQGKHQEGGIQCSGTLMDVSHVLGLSEMSRFVDSIKR
jgi:hypothetical protein